MQEDECTVSRMSLGTATESLKVDNSKMVFCINFKSIVMGRQEPWLLIIQITQEKEV